MKACSCCPDPSWIIIAGVNWKRTNRVVPRQILPAVWHYRIVLDPEEDVCLAPPHGDVTARTLNDPSLSYTEYSRVTKPSDPSR